MTKHLMSDPAEHKASVEASKAWDWLKKVQKRTLDEWLKIGRGFTTGRSWAMRLSASNQPMGRGYNEKFSEWLNAYELADIDQADRSNLFKLMDRPEIIAWRNNLPDDKRNALNHPTTILRAYARTATAREQSKEGLAKRTSTELAAALQRIHELEMELEQAKAYIEELEAARR